MEIKKEEGVEWKNRGQIAGRLSWKREKEEN